MINNLNKKRERDDKAITITLGKLPKGYYYIGDSISESIKIKIPIGGLSKEDNPPYNKGKAVKGGKIIIIFFYKYLQIFRKRSLG